MIPNFDYRRSLSEIESEVREAFLRVLASGHLILGPETEAFEAEFAAFIGTRYCVGVSSGTTALQLAFMALDMAVGDEVITVANTCAPTVAAIRLAGGTPVLVDVNAGDLLMDPEAVESCITPRTRCVLPVHLWGGAVDLDRLTAVAERHGIPLVEDCAQAHATQWRGQNVGTFGVMGCFSFYPTKNVGAFGDAGAVVTDDEFLAARLRRLRMYGYEGAPVAQEDGMNGRISEIQAAILRVKLRVYPQWLERRLQTAQLYDEILDPGIRRLGASPWCRHTYHQYVIRVGNRDSLAESLRKREIATAIHYPVPIHRMPAYQSVPGLPAELPVTDHACREILSLPIHEALSHEEARTVASAVNEFAHGTGVG